MLYMQLFIKYQVNADLFQCDMSEVVDGHPCIAVVTVCHDHPVWLMSLEPISLVFLTTTLNDGKEVWQPH